MMLIEGFNNLGEMLSKLELVVLSDGAASDSPSRLTGGEKPHN